MTKDVKIIVEQHADGFVAYPVGLRGVIVGQSDTRAEAIADVTSAIQFHVESFGVRELETCGQSSMFGSPIRYNGRRRS